MIYNHLNNERALEFATIHRLPTREYCVRARGVGRKGKSDVSKVAGNGEFGFPRRSNEDEVRFDKTVDGTGLKKARKTACKPRKNISRLATSYECSRDLELIKHKAKSLAKRKRRANRNRKASYKR